MASSLASSTFVDDRRSADRPDRNRRSVDSDADLVRDRGPIVQTTLGRVRGARHAGVNLFCGIRYGLAQRFGAPGFPQRASGIIDAPEFGPSAPQRDNKYHPQAEDCLFLNVWTPEPRRGVVYTAGNLAPRQPFGC